jgi:toxin ParE1/3/4
MGVVLTIQAELDLEEIADYIALDNPNRALSFVQELREHCEKIAKSPRSYARRPALGNETRACSHGNYMIVFEPFEDSARVLRVLHGARRWRELLESQDLEGGTD